MSSRLTSFTYTNNQILVWSEIVEIYAQEIHNIGKFAPSL